jgi:hypothetical protein
VSDCERHPGGRLPVPARITLALDLRELYGPEVDRACGVQEPAVDQWELGVLVPTPAQIRALAKLTGFPLEYFYEPAPPPVAAIICWRGGKKGMGKRHCERVSGQIVPPAAEGKPHQGLLF